MKFKVVIPVTDEMSPCYYIVSDKTMETKEEEALWHYNRSREHDGFGPVTELPKGTRFLPLFS